MNIVVCVKHVPDTEARVQIAGDSKSIETEDINFILNPFDEFAVEQALLMAVEEEVHKERRVSGFHNEVDVSNEVYRRIYGETRPVLLKCFRQEAGYPQLRSTTLAEMKGFSYWLFKYRIERCERAKVASDTRKALEYLKRQWDHQGIFGVLAAADLSAERPR